MPWMWPRKAWQKQAHVLLATGGYGRGELSPHSDIDLMFLYPKTSMGKSLTTKGNNDPGNPLSLVGYWFESRSCLERSQRGIIESQKDIRNKNSMLDARYLCGDRKIAEKFIDKFHKFCRKNNPPNTLRSSSPIKSREGLKKVARFSYRPPM